MNDGARHFGLTDAEVLATLEGCVHEVGPYATVEELLDELPGALARNIVAKHRRRLTGGHGAVPEEGRVRSKDPR